MASIVFAVLAWVGVGAAGVEFDANLDARLIGGTFIAAGICGLVHLIAGNRA